MKTIKRKNIYLERLAGPMEDKLRVARYIPSRAKSVLDIGSADGAITLALAKMFPHIKFLGVDLNYNFIRRASKKIAELKLKNVHFERIYLRDLLARKKRFDAILFTSVLHEFYTYGEGISSVVKALADAHELLKPNGEIVLRDMILHEYTKHTKFHVDDVLEKVLAKRNKRYLIKDFEKYFGKMTNIYTLNHFLLKYPYEENWSRECPEHYVPITFEEYLDIFRLLGMELQFMDSYLLPYLKEKWQKDFDLTDAETSVLKSTGLLVARKISLK